MMPGAPFQPDWTVPPGMFLARMLADRGLGEDEVAERAGLPLGRVRGLIDGTIPFDQLLAVRIGAAVAVDPEFWLRAQATYESDLAAGRTPWPAVPHHEPSQGDPAMATAVRMMLPVQEHAHDRPCPACQGRGVTGAMYEMPAGAAADPQAPEVVLLLEVFCPGCGGCGNGDPEHAGCQAAWHPDPDDGVLFGDDDPDDPEGGEDGEDGGQGCPSCGSGRGWFPIQGFTGEGAATEMYTLRGLCGCATGRLVPEGGTAGNAPAGPGDSGPPAALTLLDHEQAKGADL